MPPTTHLSGPEMDEACMQVPERDVPAAGQGHAGRAGAFWLYQSLRATKEALGKLCAAIS